MPGQQAISTFISSLAKLPVTVEADDARQCPLPRDSEMWPLIATACFSHDGQPVPVIDTSKLFGSGFG